jgi:integrase
MRRPFYLYRRKTADPKRSTYYVQYLQDGKRQTAISTGCTTRAQAEAWARARIAKGAPLQPTLEEYATGFFDEGSSWVTRQREKGRRFSVAIRKARSSHLSKHILPQFGKRRLTEIMKRDVESWLAGLAVGNSMRNQVLFSLRIILRDAVDAGILYANPLERFEMFGSDAIERDPFTLAELGKLFPDAIEGLLKVWGDAEIATAFTLLATTGIRSGEVRALRWANVLKDDRALYIDSSCKTHEGDRIGTTKSGDARVVLLPAKAREALQWWRGASLWTEPGDLLFRGQDGRPRPQQWLQRAFRPALKAAKVEVGDRVLVIHSFRHTYNSMMRSVLPEAILRAMTGHKSEAMTAHYDHPGPEELLHRVEGAAGLLESAWGQDNMEKLTPGGEG